MLDKDVLIGGWAVVYRSDRSIPHKITVQLKEYIKKTREGHPTRFWAGMQATMIRKVAVVHALREAFPSDLSDLYIQYEMRNRSTEPPEPEPEVFVDGKPLSEVLDEIENIGEALDITQGQIRQRILKYKGKEGELLKELQDLPALKQQAEVQGTQPDAGKLI